MARLPDLQTFATEHGLKIGTIAGLIEHRSRTESLVNAISSRSMQTAHGEFKAVAYQDSTSGAVHLALIKGDIDPSRETLVRVHEPISVLDFLDTTSQRHSFSVDLAMRTIAAADCGVIVLLHRAEPGADLLDLLQNDTPAARPANKWDPRAHGIGAQILRDLKVGKMRVLANPRKIPSMVGFGLEVCGYLSAAEAQQS
jgi:3,4-dihydroxy 2-butanone 4-phosphate synthase/GTP cyclohydrolase II